MALDMRAAIADDFLLVDATESVTLYQPTSTTATPVPYTAGHARRTNKTVTWAGAGGSMVPGVIVTFYLWDEDILDADGNAAPAWQRRPRLNARIVDADGKGYKVAGTSVKTTMRTRYDVECTEET